MITDILPSYLYTEYNEDVDLQALVDAQNIYARAYFSKISGLNLPIYTTAPIADALLDWVAQGLYGIQRGVLGSPVIQNPMGTYNSSLYNTTPYNSFGSLFAQPFFATTDDIFRRIMTWIIYKGDGKQYNTRWLKRRVMRFLTGTDGIDPSVDQTYRVSVKYSPNNVITIGIINRIQGAVPGQQLPPFPAASFLKQAIDSGLLPLPFQYKYVVNING